MIKIQTDQKTKTTIVENIQIHQERGWITRAAYISKANVEWVEDETGWASRAVIRLTEENEEAFWTAAMETLSRFEGVEDLAIPRYEVCRG